MSIPSTIAREAGPLDLGRLGRVQAELAVADCAGALLFDPINLRYATGTSRSSLWNMHGMTRYGFVPAAGPAILFDNPSTRHVYQDAPALAEIRPASTTCFWTAGPRVEDNARRCAREIAALARTGQARSPRLAVDRCDPALAAALAGEGLTILPAGPLLERARSIKLPEEVAQIRRAMAVCDAALAAIEEALEPGITEQQLWANLHAANAANGGEWIETRLLSSGPRTNPWYQEVSARVIAAGDLVAVDTDMIGPGGYLADISRTFLCGDGKPTGAQRDLFALALEQLQHNLSLIRPGAGLREVAEKSWRLPARFRKQRYLCVAHGAGLCNEYPNIVYPEDYAAAGYDGVIEENMVLCVESYLGAEGAREGVKLEQQILVTAGGTEVLSAVPFDERLLAVH